MTIKSVTMTCKKRGCPLGKVPPLTRKQVLDIQFYLLHAKKSQRSTVAHFVKKYGVAAHTIRKARDGGYNRYWAINVDTKSKHRGKHFGRNS